MLNDSFNTKPIIVVKRFITYEIYLKTCFFL
jgi:hypothetical protein